MGFVAVFISRLEKPMLAVDGLAAILAVAGGIAYAVQLRHVDCGNGKNNWTNSNKLINGGCRKKDGDSYCGFDEYSDLEGRCHIASANAAFLFLGFLAALAAAILCWLAVRKAKRSYGGSV